MDADQERTLLESDLTDVVLGAFYSVYNELGAGSWRASMSRRLPLRWNCARSISCGKSSSRSSIADDASVSFDRISSLVIE